MNRLTVPGHHESMALSERCDDCGRLTRPAVVLDTSRRRQAGYDCRCGNRWVGYWRPTEIAANARAQGVLA